MQSKSLEPSLVSSDFAPKEPEFPVVSGSHQNAEMHRQTLIHRAMPSGKSLVGFVFQHDNDPKQTVSGVKAWLDRKHTL